MIQDATGPLAEDDGLGAVLVADLDEPVRHVIDGFVPAHALPLVLAAVLRVALHGIQQAVLVVGHFGKRQAADAQATFVVRVLRVAFHLHQLAVLVGVQQDAAAEMAAGARPGASARDGEVPLLVLVRLLVWNGQVLVFSHELTSPLVLLHPPQSGYNEAGRTAALPPTRHRRGGRSKRSIGLARTVAGRMPETLSTETVLLGMEAGKQTDSPGGRQYGKQYETFL